MAAMDIFQPIANSSGAIPGNIGERGDHPVPRTGINQSSPISTNKFYANMFLGGQAQGTWTHPYSVAWSKGGGSVSSWGMSISHIEAYQRAYGPPNKSIPGSPVQFYINPLGIQAMILSAAELQGSTVLSTDSLQAFSVNVNLRPQAGASGCITFPLVQGMGFVTGIYKGLQPIIQSGVIFRSFSFAGTAGSIFKYRVILEDGSNWLLYACSANATDPQFQRQSNTMLRGASGWHGVVQICKNPAGVDGESKYDGSAGVYATSATIHGTVNGTSGTYSLSWQKGGVGYNPLLMFALPHHVESFAPTTASASTKIKLQTTTKGVATAIVADSWTLLENDLPTDMGFAPWSPSNGSVTTLSRTAMAAINNVGPTELSQDMMAQTNLDSLYYSGKALSKFATMIYTIYELGKNPNLAAAGLGKLKDAFNRFASNRQTYPLVYDTAWKGIVSSGSYVTGNSGQDFGNTYYNDHHFHFAYFIHCASIIGYLDRSWLGQNKDFVNLLVRDAANPSAQDSRFPFSRSFDWYHGHSFAKGLFESGDSKDEESSSEDAMFAYAMKMWGRTVGDVSMELRGTLMLKILSRSLQNYFLLDSSNANQPPNFIGNHVTGILFENKIDHTTYFGGNFEYVQGIHMIPLNPSSALTRTKKFVTEEWNAYFTNGAVAQASKVAGGWKGLLYANLAIIDPKASFDFFAQGNFDPSWLDGGASRTWYLAYAAGLGGAP